MATTIKQLNKWANAHTSYPLDFVRIALGVFLFIKGATFITNKQYLSEILSSFRGFGSEIMIIHYVAMAHMIGGFMIVIGFLLDGQFGFNCQLFYVPYLLIFSENLIFQTSYNQVLPFYYVSFFLSTEVENTR